MSRQEEQKLLNEKHFNYPEIGDYWHEMFCPYFIVLDIFQDKFWICDIRKEVDKDHWTWDLEKSKLVDKSYFNRVKYDTVLSNNRSLGFIADVIVRGENNPFVEEFKKIKCNLNYDYIDPSIEELKSQRNYWINKYFTLLVDSVSETFPGTTIKYIDIIKEDNPKLIEKLKLLL